MRWTTLSKVELEAEREASKQRVLESTRTVQAKGNPQFAGLHSQMPRYSLGGGGYVVSLQRGRFKA